MHKALDTLHRRCRLWASALLLAQPREQFLNCEIIHWCVIVFSLLPWEQARHAHKPYWSSVPPHGHYCVVAHQLFMNSMPCLRSSCNLKLIEPVSWLLTALTIVAIFTMIDRGQEGEESCNQSHFQKCRWISTLLLWEIWDFNRNFVEGSGLLGCDGCVAGNVSECFEGM